MKKLLTVLCLCVLASSAYGMDLTDPSGITNLGLLDAMDDEIRNEFLSAAMEEVKGMTSKQIAQVDKLVEASENGDLELVRQLVTAGAPISGRRNAEDGSTALHAAALNGHKQIVHLLLVKGADPDKADVMGERPLDDAHRGGNADIIVLIEKALDAGER